MEHLLMTAFMNLKSHFSGTPCVYPIIQKEELLMEILVTIQDKTTNISKAL